MQGGGDFQSIFKFQTAPRHPAEDEKIVDSLIKGAQSLNLSREPSLLRLPHRTVPPHRTCCLETAAEARLRTPRPVALIPAAGSEAAPSTPEEARTIEKGSPLDLTFAGWDDDAGGECREGGTDRGMTVDSGMPRDCNCKIKQHAL